MPSSSQPADPPSGSTPRRLPASEVREPAGVESHNPALVCLAAWLVPGAGHFIVGRSRKAMVFFVALTVLYVVGLGFGGRIFPLEWSDPLVFLSALAQWSVLLPRLAAFAGGFGQGDVVSVNYEYANTFLIVSGLLNTLVILDAFDLARRRKPR